MEHNLCVLIDFENIAAGAEKEGLGRFKLELVIRRLKDKGRILSARAYGDWGRFAKFKQDLLRLGITLMELTSYRGQEKNRADIALVVDAMELAYTRPHLDTFVVLSGDSDFTPLIMRLKELNKRVLGVGTRRSTSALLKDACDEFIFYDTLVKEQSELYPMVRREPEPREAPDEDDETDEEEDGASTLSKEEAYALIVQTLKGLQHDTSGAISGGLVKASLLRKEPAFNETEYGFSTFTRMLEAAAQRGLLSLHRDERAGGVRVELPTEPSAPPPPQAEAAEEEETPELPGLSGEAARLRQALAELGVDPLPRLYRHTVVYEFADHIHSRMQAKKRNTLLYTVGDIARRCRDTMPTVPARDVRSVINALAQAGELVHPDGKPARSPTAPFIIRKDAEGLLEALSSFYLHALSEKGERLDNSVALSQLLYGDDDHTMIVEEMVAWLMHERAHEAASAEEPPASTDNRRREERRDDRGPQGRDMRQGRDERGRQGRDERGRQGRDERGRQGRDDRRREERRPDEPAPISPAESAPQSTQIASSILDLTPPEGATQVEVEPAPAVAEPVAAEATQSEPAEAEALPQAADEPTAEEPAKRPRRRRPRKPKADEASEPEAS